MAHTRVPLAREVKRVFPVGLRAHGGPRARFGAEASSWFSGVARRRPDCGLPRLGRRGFFAVGRETMPSWARRSTYAPYRRVRLYLRITARNGHLEVLPHLRMNARVPGGSVFMNSHGVLAYL